MSVSRKPKIIIEINDLVDLVTSSLLWFNGFGITLQEAGCLAVRAIELIQLLEYPTFYEFLRLYLNDPKLRFRQLPHIVASYALVCNEIDCKNAAGIRICGFPRDGAFTDVDCGVDVNRQEAIKYFIFAHYLNETYWREDGIPKIKK